MAAGLAAVLFLGHLLLFFRLFRAGVVSDFPAHRGVVRISVEDGTWTGDFLFYLTSAAFAGFGTGLGAIRSAMVFILAAAVAAKFLVSAAIALREAAPAQVRSGIVLVVGVGLLTVAFSLPARTIHVGQFPPNVFHNSTTIFVMPFAVALFGACAAYLRAPSRSWLWAIAGSATLNVLAKPSFVFPLLVVFPVAALIRFGRRPESWRALAVTAFMGALVAAQYVYVYKSGSTEAIYKAGGVALSGKGGVAIKPFEVWHHFALSVPLSFACSVGFPAVALAVYRRRLWDYDLFRFAGALLGVSVVMYALLAETGQRIFHGNFVWQAIIASYVLFLVVLIRAVQLWGREQRPAEAVVVGLAFSAHVVAGAAFLGHYLSAGTYL